MARPKKKGVDYFPHDCITGKTIFILEQKFKNDGYAFWFKLLEFLGTKEGHYLDCNNIEDMEFLQAKTHLGEDIVLEILDLLAKLQAIDRDLWVKRIVWSQRFVDGISDVYVNRRVETPSKPNFYIVSTDHNSLKPEFSDLTTSKSTQSKVKESKEEESKEKRFPSYPNPSDMNGLPEIKIGSAIELIWHTKNLKITNDKVLGLWNVFKIQNLTGKKFYADESDVHSHFINWIKKQDFKKIESIISNSNPAEDEARRILKQINQK